MINWMTAKSKADYFLNKKESWILIIFIGFLFKLLLFPVKLGDYNFYLKPWIDFIKANGFTASLKYDFYNYTPSYIYILIGLAKMGLNPLFSIKLVSISFEYILAFFVGKIAVLKFKDNLLLLKALAVVPLVPSILLNGAFWGQCDSIYSAFVVGSIYFILNKNQLLSIIFLGIAFAFKIQTIFILPFYFVLLLREKLKWYYFLFVPLIYLISIFPTWYFGRQFTDLLTIYITQSSYYEGLTIFFPNIYIWVSDDYFKTVQLTGFAIVFTLTFISGIYLSKKKIEFTFDTYIKLAFLSVIITPFLLPGMHERYLYLGDAMAILYYLVFRKNLRLTIGILSVSFYSYLCCSRLQNILPLWPAFFIYLYIIILAVNDFRDSFRLQQFNKN